jgi:predicted DNA-binding transcriptional regulator AlpA
MNKYIVKEVRVANGYQDKLLTAVEASDILGLKESTLAQYRWRGDTRLPWVKLGKAIRYKLSDIEAYIEGNVIKG